MCLRNSTNEKNPFCCLLASREHAARTNPTRSEGQSTSEVHVAAWEVLETDLKDGSPDPFLQIRKLRRAGWGLSHSAAASGWQRGGPPPT